MVSVGELFEVQKCVQKTDSSTGEMYYSVTVANQNGSFYCRFSEPVTVGGHIKLTGKLKISKGFFNIDVESYKTVRVVEE